jgi:NAD(P)H-flavin reductase
MIRRALASGFAQPIRLILSVRDRSEVFALDALHALSRRFPRFSYTVTLTRAPTVEPATGWRQGRVPAWLADELPDLSAWQVLAAGSPGFVDAAVAAARNLGAFPERILTDSFTATVP